MIVKVTKDTVKIIDEDYILNKGEYKVNKCYFEFSDDYTDDLVKKAIFEHGDIKVEMLIANNECDIPYEVLNFNTFELRVYAYQVDGEDLILRYSPTYTNAFLREGSYDADATQGEEITPSQYEQYEQALNDGLVEVNSKLVDVDAAIEETNNLNINVSKLANITTVALTKKDSTVQTVQILDGQKGETGEQGEQGEQGAKGEKGDKGDKGDTGATGPEGPRGEQGPQGVQGPKGDKGDKGDTGLQGPQGERGPAGQNGQDGQDGVGVVSGGTTGQVLAKKTNTDYDTEWIDISNPDLSNYYTKSQVDDLIPEIPENVSYFKNDMEYLTEKINQTVSGNSVILNKTRNYKLKLSLKPSEITQNGTPSPDNPISVNTVTGNNTITIQGKNLFDYNNTTVEALFGNPATKETNGYKGGWAYNIVLQNSIKPGTYTISLKVKDADNSPTANMRLVDENNQEIEGTIMNCNSTSNLTITTTKTISKLKIDNGLNAVTTLIYDIQIEANSTMTEYNAYQSQNYSINLGSIEYAKIGSAEDNIYRDDNGDWYFEEHIGKKVLNGTENWLYSTLSNDTIASAFVRGLGGKNLSTYMCNKFPYLAYISVYTTVEYCGTNGDAMRLGVFKSRLTTPDLQGLTSWLSQNNIKVYFELATPTTTQITDTTLITQLETLYQNATAYEGTTNVSQTNADLPFKFDIKAKIELDDYATKEYVNDLVGNIETALGGI